MVNSLLASIEFDSLAKKLLSPRVTGLLEWKRQYSQFSHQRFLIGDIADNNPFMAMSQSITFTHLPIHGEH